MILQIFRLKWMFSYENFKRRVLKFAETGDPDPITLYYGNFIRPNIKRGEIVSAPTTKLQRTYISKGVVGPGPDYIVRDFGWRRSQEEYSSGITQIQSD